MWQWLVRDWQWPAAALFASVFLLAALVPFGVPTGEPVALVAVQLPVYMLHQWEEHAGDRFRRYINRVIGRGREVLTPAATFWINALGVWGVDLLALYACWLLGPAAGLAAGYLAVVNGCSHVIQAVALREYNPGLWTAAVLLVPVGGWGVWAAGAGAGLWAHAIGLVAALGVHAAIAAHVARRRARLRTPASG
jgi:hypothetical protein